MYEAFFELKTRPFPGTPDPDCCFPAGVQEDALALLKRFLREDDGVAAVVGPIGSGKTLLARRLLGALEESQEAVMVSNVHSPEISALLKALLYDLSLSQDGDEQALRMRLADFILERFAEGQRTAVVIDEAQNLSVPQLEELRLLTNLESRRRKAVQVVLFGQLKLAATLEQPALEPLRQRVALVARLAALDADEAVDYLHFGIERAGGSPEAIFTAEALSEIVERAGGAPRRLNQLAHRAMMLACAHQSTIVTGEHAAAAASHLLIEQRAPAAPTYPTHHSESALKQLRAAPPMDDDPVDHDAHVIEVGAPLPNGAGVATAPRIFAAPAPPAAPPRVPARHRRLFS